MATAIDDVQAVPLTQRDWLTALEPVTLIRILAQQEVFVLSSTPRKLRLYCVALVRSLWEQIGDDRIKAACVTAELFASGRASEDAALDGYETACRVCREFRRWPLKGPSLSAAAHLAGLACFPRVAAGYPDFQEALWFADELGVTRKDQAAMLRCLFRDPFCRETGDPFTSLRNSFGAAALASAHRAEEARRFHEWPGVAAALAVAGMGPCELIQHLRGLQRCAACLGCGKLSGTMLPCEKCAGSGWLLLPLMHVGGCWAMDVLVGH